MLSIEKRVRRTEEGQESVYESLALVGTVKKCSPFGYTTVVWDNGVEERYSPMNAALALREVIGDDALPRHMWNTDVDLDNPPCRVCSVIQTEENEFGPCKP
jgi:hypothetical protein